jgi:membrane-bound metal-dependent hydrolase YbcI (DUF457 family)
VLKNKQPDWEISEKPITIEVRVPFTVSHTVAAVPLRKFLGRFGVLSALVIGSIAPDLPNFFPVQVSRHTTHSLLGLFLFCIPVGFIFYIFFHKLLKGPLLSLLPSPVLCRLGRDTRRCSSLPAASLGAVVVSLLCGAMSHIVWDAFTHKNAVGVNLFPFLRTFLFSIGNYPLYGYRILQHGSTLIGLVLLAVWARKWMKVTPVQSHRLPVVLSPTQRLIVITAVVSVVWWIAVRSGLQTLGTHTGVLAVQTFARGAVFSGLPAITGTFLVYCLGWHLVRLYRTSAW